MAKIASKATFDGRPVKFSGQYRKGVIHAPKESPRESRPKGMPCPKDSFGAVWTFGLTKVSSLV